MGLDQWQHCYISRLDGLYDTRPRDYLLSTIFKEMRQGNATLTGRAEGSPYRTLAEVTERARELRYQHGNKEAYQNEKSDMPQFTPAAVLTTRSDVKDFSHLVCLEWDGDIDTANALMIGKQHPNVLAIWRSLSVNPKFLTPITPVSTDGDELTTDNFKHAWYSASCLFEEIGDADTTAMSPTQPQALCYDPDIFVNWDALPVNWDIDEFALKEAYPNLLETENLAYAQLPVEYHIAIQEMQWKPDGWGETSVPCPWASHENDGWGSRENGTGIHKNDENDFTFHCFKCPTSKRYSDNPMRFRTAPRLEINETEQAVYKDSLCTPQTNEGSLQNAITEFLRHLESNTSDTTHLFILKYATGIGKSYGALTHARKLGKKVLSLLFNHDLAAEQTHTAQMLGYNAYRFRGRSYNFENSKLCSLPLEMREQNETLFREKDVMCPVYDKLEPYHEKRLNPYMLCFSCPLLDACKSEGYWSQFTELRYADYLSACIQDILFNPDFWTLLDTFLTGSVPFEEPETDEEAAIATMLGLQTETSPDNETQDIFQPFDFAMIDDYTTAELYSEAHYTLQEISNLKKAWAGTPTGDVLNPVFDAILLLYDPDGTQRSVDILTELFDSLDDETKDKVNTHLTKHADRDEYGDVIPTAPWTALRKGIASLDTLTPVWHSKDWTLLHQLETLINHCENTTQAPMFIDSDGNITLSIPPQVHPKLKAVLLMSATADFPITKNAFRRQPVTFTTSEGKPSHWAKGVKGFQYVNARWTTQSIFEFQKDENGKTVYDDDGKPIIEGLRPKAIEMLQKLTELARADNRKCVFIGYKDFVEGEIAELDIVKALHDTFDTITHYDIAPGMNFDGYKIFVTFGLPKIHRNTIKHEASVQFAHDPDPLDFDYTTTTEKGEVYTSTHGRYTDPRVEKIRQQLTTQKSQQATGRARPTRWEDTITIDFSAEPVPGFTELATPFVDTDWQQTETFDLDAVIKVRKQAEQHAEALTAENTIDDFQQAYGCGREKARQLWHEAGGKAHKNNTDAELARRVLEIKAENPNIGERKIADMLGISYGKARSIVKKNGVH